MWSAPSTEVAAELGISDVALGKLCRRLQVPKPARGYWARVSSGQAARVPPLRAYREELARSLSANERSRAPTAAKIRLTPRQEEFLKRALVTIEQASGVPHGVTIRGGHCYDLAPALATEIVVLVENQWPRWVAADSNYRAWTAGNLVARGLLARIRPIGKPHLIVLRSVDTAGEIQRTGPNAILRSTAALQSRVTELSRLAVARALTYAAAPLSEVELACEERYVASPDTSARLTADLCVSGDTIWIRGRYQGSWREEVFETERLRIADIFDIDLMPRKVPEISRQIASRSIQPYVKRLKALEEAQSLYDALTSGSYEMERALESEYALATELVAFGRTGARPLSSARKAWAEFEAELEVWERLIEDGQREIIESVLGIHQGDTVIFRDIGRVNRILVDRASCWMYERNVTFLISGRRYRKDGQVGKREEALYLQVTDA